MNQFFVFTKQIFDLKGNDEQKHLSDFVLNAVYIRDNNKLK